MWTAIVFGKVKAAGYASVALWMIPAAIRRGDAMLWGEARRRMVRPDYRRAGNCLGQISNNGCRQLRRDLAAWPRR